MEVQLRKWLKSSPVFSHLCMCVNVCTCVCALILKADQIIK